MIKGPALTRGQRRARAARRVEEARRDLEELRGDLTPRPGEHTLHRGRARGGRRQGAGGLPAAPPRLPRRALAYPGYGGPGWVRVFGRVLLGREDTAEETGRDGVRSVRGWRNFLTVPVAGAQVTVRIGGHERVLRTNREGYLDERVEVDLPPGRHEVVLTVGPDLLNPDDLLPPDVELVEDDTEGGAELPPQNALRHSGTAEVVVVGRTRSWDCCPTSTTPSS